MQFKEYNLPNSQTPVLLPDGYKVISLEGNKIQYLNDEGKTLTSDLYAHHSENAVIVDEFRKFIPHDSILIILFTEDGKDIILQVRNEHMRWEPGKVDLASIAAQRRAIQVEDKFIKIDNVQLANKKVPEETGLDESRIATYNFIEAGKHLNILTNEYQTIFACKTDTTANELNQLMQKVAEIDRPKEWLQQDYEKTIDDYLNNDSIAKNYAGGLDLRAKGFFSNEEIRNNLNKARQ